MTPRLHSVTVTCAHRGLFDIETATAVASLLAAWHGWTTAVSISTPCGCIHLYRDADALRAAAVRHGWDMTEAEHPAPAERRAMLH